jgi:hypothetical protein
LGGLAACMRLLFLASCSAVCTHWGPVPGKVPTGQAHHAEYPPLQVPDGQQRLAGVLCCAVQGRSCWGTSPTSSGMTLGRRSRPSSLSFSCPSRTQVRRRVPLSARVAAEKPCCRVFSGDALFLLFLDYLSGSAICALETFVFVILVIFHLERGSRCQMGARASAQA